MNKEQMTEEIISAKDHSGLTFEELGVAIGRDKVWTASAVMGQATMNKEEANTIGDKLNLTDEAIEALQKIAMRGSLDQAVPTDPLIYRFHEITQVYGTTLKQVIHEIAGDGIMSAIDFTMDIEKKEDDSGDRIVITMDGKFLPYKKW